MWIRPHYVNSMEEIDRIIEWCKQENLDTDLFRMGKELEISFYYRIFSVVAAKHAVPNKDIQLSTLFVRCLSDLQENSTQPAVTELCKKKPEFGPYVKLNNDIFFEDIHLNIYHIFVAPVSKEIYLVAKWNEANGIVIFKKRELFPFEERSSHYRIAGAPFIQIQQDKSGSRRYTGYCMDLIKKISEQLNFTYEVYDVPLVQYKRLYFEKAMKGSKIYGIVPELHEGNANIALANIHPTSAGELLVDFTIPFYEDVGLAALIKISKESNALWQFLLIIEWPVALCTVVSVLISTVLANRLTSRSFLQELDDVEQLFDQNKIHYSVVEGSSSMKYFQRLAEVEKALVE
ncbi:Lig chan-Glu bd domain containing protein [Trichuris trichiura]|uniref:Lig chan-Glu bd domain containing protein n=1 Tax=Trichuris trichiura TaxID=36087 RepID=A0A077ZJM9_TRITR|nr:Lig chan-Glu bd domain containing protein [Trichuris trichiura]